MSAISDNIRRVRDLVAEAATGAGRKPEDITIIAVTKTFGADMVNSVVGAGIIDIGENRVQEFLQKIPDVKVDCRWHLIGHLQRNKVARVVGKFTMIHSVDSLRLAESIDRVGRERGEVTDVLLQVNTSREESKAGVLPEELPDLVDTIVGKPQLRLRGLMTIGPTSGDLSRTRACFIQLRDLCEKLKSESGLDLPELSMGMSGDFAIAIEEGATMVRVGSLITGARV
jgi:pyridoxal phosphate enzyme (YggS family)